MGFLTALKTEFWCDDQVINQVILQTNMRKHNKKKETPKKSTYVHLALTKHHTNGTSSNMSRHMTKKRFMGHPSSALNVENHFLPKGI